MIFSSFYKRLCCLRHGSTHKFPHPMTEDQTMKLLFVFVLGGVGLLPAGREAWLSIPYTGHLPRKLYIIIERYIGTRSMQIVRDLEKAFLPLAHCSSKDTKWCSLTSGSNVLKNSSSHYLWTSNVISIQKTIEVCNFSFFLMCSQTRQARPAKAIFKS